MYKFYLFFFLGLKPGGQYEIQVLGATQNGLPHVDFSWQIVDLPSVNPIMPVPDLSFSTRADDHSIMVCIWNLLFKKFFYKTIFTIQFAVVCSIVCFI